MFEFYQDKSQEWRWRVTAGNNEIIAASSEGYKNLNDCKQNVQLLMRAIFNQAMDILSQTSW